MKRNSACLAFVLLVAASACLAAQTRDMRGALPLRARVTVQSARMSGDTVTLGYAVTNIGDAAKGESLWLLIVDNPQPAESVFTPRWADWQTHTDYRGEAAAVWRVHGAMLAPGQTTPLLEYRAVGVTDLVPYWAVPDLDAHGPLDDEDGVPAKRRHDPYKWYSDSGVTVGVAPFPSKASAANLLVRLRRLTDVVCGRRAWATPAVCGSLTVRLARARTAFDAGHRARAQTEIDDFIRILRDGAADATASVSAAALGLLLPNAIYARRRL